MSTYPDASLTNLGVEQGLTTGAVLEDVEFDFIVTSPMSRALETCVLLCQHGGMAVRGGGPAVGSHCPIIICPEAREFCYASFAVGNIGT